MPRGGPRPNSGPKKGSKHQATISKEQARDALRQIVLARMATLVGAQLANAEGLKYLVVRDKKTGKFLRVTEAMARAKSGQNAPDSEETIEVWEKDPSVPAFTDLLNRALDKPKEQEQELKLTGDAEFITALQRGRQRASHR